MNYELCTKLKDAGFKQYGSSFLWIKPTNTKVIRTTLVDPLGFEEKGYVYYPLLSELIEACGKIRTLERATKGWVAGDNIKTFCHGDTPEEAVANLYLALNNK